MASGLPLRAAIARGAVLTLANWPVVIVDFVVESLYKFALAAPVIGGAFMVAVLMGGDLQALLADGLMSSAEQVFGALGHTPAALWAFLAAGGLVGAGGAVLMYVVKAGTIAVLVRADGQAADIQRVSVSHRVLREARAYGGAAFLEAVRHYRRRSIQLALLLSGGYGLLTALYVVALTWVSRAVAASSLQFAWPLFVLLATTGAVLCLTGVNLYFDLCRVIVVHDDCPVRTAMHRVRTFVIADARRVLGIFAVMGLFMLLAMAVALTATVALTLIAWVPVVGFVFLPLQAAFWIVRGLLFQSMGLVTVAAYQTQYRRYAEPERPTAFFRARDL